MSIPRVKVPVHLGGQDRQLVLSLNALCKAEEATGINFLVGQPTFSSLRVMRALVWAGLLHADPHLTLEQVGDMIEDVGADNVLDAIMTAYMAAMPDEDPEDDDAGGGGDDAADPPSRQPGGVFGPPDATT